MKIQPTEQSALLALQNSHSNTSKETCSSSSKKSNTTETYSSSSKDSISVEQQAKTTPTKPHWLTVQDRAAKAYLEAELQVLACLGETDKVDLDLSGIDISFLPSTFGNPEISLKLESLNLCNSSVSCLPDYLRLPKLKCLNICNTKLTQLPETIFNLPKTCIVHLTRSNFSKDEQNNIKQKTSSKDYSGPKFEFEKEK